MTVVPAQPRECSVARTLEIVGEKWALLAIREVFLGNRRFDEMIRRTGAPRDTLTARLRSLVCAGILERRQYSEQPARYEYWLTEAGQELQVILGALQQWGDEHLPHPEGPSMLRRRRGPGGAPLHVGYIDDDGREVTLPDVRMIPAGPAAGR